MNRGTIIRTILALATVINSGAIAAGIAEFENPTVDMVYKVVSFIATAMILFLNTYYNNDYTEIAAEYTAEMRQKKLEESDNYAGERFYDDMYPEEEDDDEQ